MWEYGLVDSNMVIKMVIIEGLVMCFILLLICVIGIANGPVGLVIFYEQEVKDRVIELGLTTKDRIRDQTAYKGK